MGDLIINKDGKELDISKLGDKISVKQTSTVVVEVKYSKADLLVEIDKCQGIISEETAKMKDFQKLLEKHEEYQTVETENLEVASEN